MSHKFKVIIRTIFLILISNVSIAEDSDELEEYALENMQESWWSKQVGVVMSSIIASQYPEESGVVLTLLSPFILAGNDHDYIRYSGFGGMASIGLYNSLEMKKDKYSKSDVFKRNLVAFHIFFGTAHLLEKKYRYTSSALSVRPVSDGFAIGYNYKF